ncbi:hypothetical protein ASU31_00120 [Pedobacter ginsenosidimutans]|uniref:Plasmid transfer protein n=1 Tax=Pedobacter ginsenosidimutans TaxID=687842 RepID=A0A0T5VV53_9SPHI|nr:hypothetical protein [Pedobacter ginsenosidimutans]KRT17739.1 hypothetical protein ASU31_00120 [Pedobacter ginsenosidimutans]
MKKGLLFVILSWFFHSHAQLNVELLHQLVGESKTEHDKQTDARDRQVASSANEETNKTLMVRLKNKYREIHSRFKTVSLAINAAQIGIYAYPLLNDIAISQGKIYDMCRDDALLLILAIHSEADMGDRAYSLLNFLYALSLSFEDINQMKPSDRKLLFSHVVTELRSIAGVSRGLATTLQYSSRKKILDGLNPFSGFINTDKKLVNGILNKSQQLKN